MHTSVTPSELYHLNPQIGTNNILLYRCLDYSLLYSLPFENTKMISWQNIGVDRISLFLVYH